jgi:GH15 family glucan-1,4-alpha-glucosidase
MSQNGDPRAANQIGDYGLIGDCVTAALVDRRGSIDWLCWPRFDSDACFAALVGSRENGFWQIAPTARFSSRRSYRRNTLVLETVFESPDGEAALVDFMAEQDGVSHVVRLVEGRSGRVALQLQLVLRFGYGRTTPWVSRLPDGALCGVAGPSMVVLRTPVETRGKDLATLAEFSVAAGDRIPFVLGHQPSHLPPAPPLDVEAALRCCEGFWRGWVARRREPGDYDDAVDRSLITLKAMTFAPTGGLVAAPTTSLPEAFGGERNWDYRYSWVRDSTLTLLALMNAGHTEEAEAWLAWLHRAVAGDPAELQIMYGLGGERRLAEWQADWLAGFAQSRPVRIGNAAHAQFSSMSTASSWTPSTRPGAPGCARRRRCGRCRARWSTMSPRSGANPTTGSGRFAASAGGSPIRG